jgi:teichuronic acid biosynthesis glycosyltransferase TuaC
MLRILAVTNIYPTADSPASGTFVEEQITSLITSGVDVEVLHVDRDERGMSAYIGIGRTVRGKVAQYQPDLVHIMYGGVLANSVTRALNNVPTIVSFCGSDLLGQRSSGRIRGLIAKYGVIASRKAARRATGIVVKSKNLRDALPRFIDSSKVRIIPSGIDLTNFKPLEREQCRLQLDWNRQQFCILFPANSGDPIKRPELARAAVAILRNRGVPAELKNLRGVSHKDVPLWINGSNVLLITSVHEGSPNVVKEALACNVPVVSVDVGDVRERTNGIEGCYVAAPEPAAVADKLQRVYESHGRIAGRKAVEELSLERVAARLREFYQQTLLARSVGYKVIKPADTPSPLTQIDIVPSSE